jgi:hypothetical protein
VGAATGEQFRVRLQCPRELLDVGRLGHRCVDRGGHCGFGEEGIDRDDELDQRGVWVGVVIAALAATRPAVPVAERHLPLIAALGADLWPLEARRAEPIVTASLHCTDLAAAASAARRCDRPRAGRPQRQQQVTDRSQSRRSARRQHRRTVDDRGGQPSPLGASAGDLLDHLSHHRWVQFGIRRADRRGDGGEWISHRIKELL